MTATIVKVVAGKLVAEAISIVAKSAAESVHEGRFLLTRNIKLFNGEELVVKVAISTERVQRKELPSE